MHRDSAIGIVSALAAKTRGVFRGRDAEALRVTRRQFRTLIATGVIERELPDTYRMSAIARTHDVALQAALLWAGESAAGAGASAGFVYGLESVAPPSPCEIGVPHAERPRTRAVIVHRLRNPRSMMVRTHRGFRVTGVESTLVALAATLDSEAFEVACEDARRRQLTSVPALSAYLDRFGERGRSGVGTLRGLLRQLDPAHPSASTLEVKTRRLLVAHGVGNFVREFPLDGRRFDFAFPQSRVILETNGRRWHTDPLDFEHDNEKWSVPARHGYRLVFATWRRVVHQPNALLRELRTTLAA
jgi:very-short-patch-repair endonuclease